MNLVDEIVWMLIIWIEVESFESAISEIIDVNISGRIFKFGKMQRMYIICWNIRSIESKILLWHVFRGYIGSIGI